MQFIWFCDLLSVDIGVLYGVWSTDKNCDDIIPLIEHLLNSPLLRNYRSLSVYQCMLQNTPFLHPYESFAHFLFPIQFLSA